MQRSFPVTAAGPFRFFTGFPILPTATSSRTPATNPTDIRIDLPRQAMLRQHRRRPLVAHASRLCIQTGAPVFQPVFVWPGVPPQLPRPPRLSRSPAFPLYCSNEHLRGTGQPAGLVQALAHRPARMHREHALLGTDQSAESLRSQRRNIELSPRTFERSIGP